MKLEIITNVKGLEKLKELLDSATKPIAELEEILNKISETEISVEFEPKIYKGGESMTDTEITMNVARELYSQIMKELKEKGFTEEVLNAINTLLEICRFVRYC